MKRKQTKLHRLYAGNVFSFCDSPDDKHIVDGITHRGSDWSFRIVDGRGRVSNIPYSKAQVTRVFKWVNI